MSLADYRYRDLIHRCFRCGYCKFPTSYLDVNNCPAYARYRLESYSTGGRLWLIRAWLNDEMEWTDHLAEIVFSCATCKNCTEQCPLPFSQDIVNMIVAARCEMVERGLMPAAVQQFLENVQRHGNPYGAPRSKRAEWFQGTDVEQYDGQEYLYYVGCVGSYDTRARETARTLAHVLKRGGVSFGVLGDRESCDGNDVAKLGEEGLFESLAEENIEQFKELGVTKVVTLSPHAYNAMRNDYPSLNGTFEVFHYTQLLNELIKKGTLDLSRGFDARVTYHDPCFLGRWNGEYEAPRAALRAVPGIELVEMERSRADTLCCGGGGGNFYTDFLGGSEDSPARIRIRQARDSGAQVVAVACPNCMTMLEDAAKAERLDESLSIRDVSEIVASALE
ncbi:MAG: (Fe-S)-binding protein [Chloroflexota bacterium]|nr:(Fe-S)-binding protein [Chloroflexota bacterium]